MISRGFYCSVLWAVVLFYGIYGFSSSAKNLNKDDFEPKKCTTHAQCEDEVCYKGALLKSRCDPNGTCVCDCSNAEEIPSSYTPACEGKQPDGHWRDYCDKYCTQEYLRPCRYCKDSNGNIYCTCVCPTPSNSTKLLLTKGKDVM